MNEILFRYLNNLTGQSDFFDTLILFLAEDLIFLMVAGIFILIIVSIYKAKKETLPEQKMRWRSLARHSFIALIAGVMAWVVSEIVKYYYLSPRPFLALSDINLLFEHGGNDSFPSGHAMFTFALATSLYLYHKRLGITYLTLSALAALARVASGVHWPSDILAGALLGTLIALLINKILKPKPNKSEN